MTCPIDTLYIDEFQNKSETSRPSSELSCDNERGLTTDNLGEPV